MNELKDQLDGLHLDSDSEGDQHRHITDKFHHLRIKKPIKKKEEKPSIPRYIALLRSMQREAAQKIN